MPLRIAGTVHRSMGSTQFRLHAHEKGRVCGNGGVSTSGRTAAADIDEIVDGFAESAWDWCASLEVGEARHLDVAQEGTVDVLREDCWPHETLVCFGRVVMVCTQLAHITHSLGHFGPW